MIRFFYCVISLIGALSSAATINLTPELIAESQKLKSYGFPIIELANNPENVLNTIHDYVNQNLVHVCSNIEPIHEPLINTLLMLAQSSNNAKDAQTFVQTTLKILQAILTLISDLKTKNYFIHSIEMLTHFTQLNNDNIGTIESNIINCHANCISLAQKSEISTNISQVALHVIKLIAQERGRQRILHPASQ